VRSLLALSLIACAHTPPTSPRPELGGVVLSVAAETVVNDPILAGPGAELRQALAKALAAEGFRVAESGGLTVVTSIDYSPWTPVSAGSIYIVVGLKNGGESVDQVELQRINEGFPEPAKVAELAHALAHALATSPRLRDYLATK